MYNLIMIKIVLVGDPGVGKTSILCNLIEEDYNEKTTIGLDFWLKEIEIDK